MNNNNTHTHTHIQKAKSERKFDNADAIAYLTKKIELKMMAPPLSPPKLVTTTSTSRGISSGGSGANIYTKKSKKRKLVKIDQEKNGEDAETSSDESTSRPEKRLRIELVKKNATKNKSAISKRTLASKKLELDTTT